MNGSLGCASCHLRVFFPVGSVDLGRLRRVVDVEGCSCRRHKDHSSCLISESFMRPNTGLVYLANLSRVT